jgi:hypothetical protein
MMSTAALKFPFRLSWQRLSMIRNGTSFPQGGFHHPRFFGLLLRRLRGNPQARLRGSNTSAAFSIRTSNSFAGYRPVPLTPEETELLTGAGEDITV